MIYSFGNCRSFSFGNPADYTARGFKSCKKYNQAGKEYLYELL